VRLSDFLFPNVGVYTSVSSDIQTVLDSIGLQQLVQSPTRRTIDASNLLNLVIGRDGSRCISSVAAGLKSASQQFMHKFDSLSTAEMEKIHVNEPQQPMAVERCHLRKKNIPELERRGRIARVLNDYIAHWKS